MAQSLEHWTRFAASILEDDPDHAFSRPRQPKGIPALDLRPTLSAPTSASGDPDLLTFLKTESDATLRAAR